VAIPAALAFLGMAFVSCVILTTGLPPLAGFLAKFALISALLAPAMQESSLDAWLLIVSLLAVGFGSLIALTRRGMRSFWATGRKTPRLSIVEAAPIAFLKHAAQSLQEPDVYIRAVMSPSARELP
jgi:multicomponent K+:H+ antiporter subunit D